MGFWITIAIVLFVLGSIMALKPGGVEVRLDRVRMTARRLELHPKVIACPDWIRGRDNEFGRGMLGQYALILEDTKFPETRYQVIDGELRPDSSSPTLDKVSHYVNPTSFSTPSQTQTAIKANYSLDREPLDLPKPIAPLVKAVYTKSNSLVVFWDDSGYVKPITNPNYDGNDIEPDLLALKARMQDWALKLSVKP